MKANSKQLKKKKSFKEVYKKELVFLWAMVLGITIPLLALKFLEFIINQFGPVYVLAPVFIIVIGSMIASALNKLISKRKLACLPLTKEECRELEITNLYEMLVFLNKFLKIRTVLSEDFSFVDYLNIDSQQAQAIIDLFSSDGEIRVKEPGESEYYYSFYFLDGYEYKDVELLNKYKEEFEKIVLAEASDGQ